MNDTLRQDRSAEIAAYYSPFAREFAAVDGRLWIFFEAAFDKWPNLSIGEFMRGVNLLCEVAKHDAAERAADASSSWPQFADDPDLVDTRTAATRAGRSQDTIRTWCVNDGIGLRYGGRWRVSVKRLQQRLRQEK